MKVNRSALINTGILFITVMLVSIILAAGRDTGGTVPVDLAIGEPAPETFIANRSTDPIEDPDATEAERQVARRSVETVYTKDNDATLTVIREVNSFFVDLKDVAIDESLIPPEESSTTSSTVEQTTSSTEPGETTSSTTTTTTEPPTTTTTTLPRRSLEDQVELLSLAHPTLTRAIPSFVELYNKDLDRIAAGEDSDFPAVEQTSLETVNDELQAGIKPTDLTEQTHQN